MYCLHYMYVVICIITSLTTEDFLLAGRLYIVPSIKRLWKCGNVCFASCLDQKQ